MTCWFSHFESWRGGHDRKVAADSTGSELVREAAAQLHAGDLRAAGRALDGRKLRELSQARRELITALTTRVLAGAGLRDARRRAPVSR